MIVHGIHCWWISTYMYIYFFIFLAWVLIKFKVQRIYIVFLFSNTASICSLWLFPLRHCIKYNYLYIFIQNYWAIFWVQVYNIFSVYIMLYWIRSPAHMCLLLAHTINHTLMDIFPCFNTKLTDRTVLLAMNGIEQQLPKLGILDYCNLELNSQLAFFVPPHYGQNTCLRMCGFFSHIANKISQAISQPWCKWFPYKHNRCFRSGCDMKGDCLNFLLALLCPGCTLLGNNSR